MMCEKTVIDRHTHTLNLVLNIKQAIRLGTLSAGLITGRATHRSHLEFYMTEAAGLTTAIFLCV